MKDEEEKVRSILDRTFKMLDEELLGPDRRPKDDSRPADAGKRREKERSERETGRAPDIY